MRLVIFVGLWALAFLIGIGIDSTLPPHLRLTDPEILAAAFIVFGAIGLGFWLAHKAKAR